MKKTILILLSLCISSSADIKDEITNSYVKGLSSLLFFTSEDILDSGYYSFDAFDGKLDSHFLPFSYTIKNNNQNYSYFLYGSLGYANYDEKSKVEIDTVHLQSCAIQLGGGVDYKTSENTHLKLATSYMYSQIHSNIKISNNVALSKLEKKAIDDVLNSEQKHHSVVFSALFSYHPNIRNYQPYANVGIRQMSTKIEDTYLNIDSIQSFTAQLKIGLLTPPLARVFGAPLSLEPYISVLSITGDMSDKLKVDDFLVIGTTFHFGSHHLTNWVENFASFEKDTLHWIKEVTFDMKLVKGHNIKGFHIGLGLKF